DSRAFVFGQGVNAFGCPAMNDFEGAMSGPAANRIWNEVLQPVESFFELELLQSVLNFGFTVRSVLHPLFAVFPRLVLDNSPEITQCSQAMRIMATDDCLLQ